MKDLKLLVWLTQLGLSTALPLAGFILLALWLRNTWGWGDWVIWAGIVLGGIMAADGFRHCIKAMNAMSKTKEKADPPPVSFNDHD